MISEQIRAKCLEANLKVEFDDAVLKPNFHFVSITFITHKHVGFAVCSKSFTSNIECYQYLLDNLDTVLKMIPSVEKAALNASNKPLN